MQIYDYLQKKATLSPITPFKMGRMEVSQTPTSILESGLLPLSIGLCKSVKYILVCKKGKATGIYRYSVLEVLQNSCNCVQLLPSTEHGSSLLQLFVNDLLGCLMQLVFHNLSVHYCLYIIISCLFLE